MLGEVAGPSAEAVSLLIAGRGTPGKAGRPAGLVVDTTPDRLAAIDLVSMQTPSPQRAPRTGKRQLFPDSPLAPLFAAVDVAHAHLNSSRGSRPGSRAQTATPRKRRRKPASASTSARSAAVGGAEEAGSAAAAATAAAAGDASSANATATATAVHASADAVAGDGPESVGSLLELPFGFSFEMVALFKRTLNALSPEVRRWCAYEWFYPSIDAHYLRHNEFQAVLDSMGLGGVVSLTRAEWSYVRSMMGKPRRLSQAFLQQEREKLTKYRNDVRIIQSSANVDMGAGGAGRGGGVIRGYHPPVPSKLAVGTRVTARHPGSRQLFNGKVLSLDGFEYYIQFDYPELGRHFVPDTQVMSHLELSEPLKRRDIGATVAGGEGTDYFSQPASKRRRLIEDPDEAPLAGSGGVAPSAAAGATSTTTTTTTTTASFAAAAAAAEAGFLSAATLSAGSLGVPTEKALSLLVQLCKLLARRAASQAQAGSDDLLEPAISSHIEMLSSIRESELALLGDDSEVGLAADENAPPPVARLCRATAKLMVGALRAQIIDGFRGGDLGFATDAMRITEQVCSCINLLVHIEALTGGGADITREEVELVLDESARLLKPQDAGAGPSSVESYIALIKKMI